MTDTFEAIIRRIVREEIAAMLKAPIPGVDVVPGPNGTVYQMPTQHEVRPPADINQLRSSKGKPL